MSNYQFSSILITVQVHKMWLQLYCNYAYLKDCSSTNREVDKGNHELWDWSIIYRFTIGCCFQADIIFCAFTHYISFCKDTSRIQEFAEKYFLDFNFSSLRISKIDLRSFEPCHSTSVRLNTMSSVKI